MFANVRLSLQRIICIWLIPAVMSVALLMSAPSLLSVARANRFGLQVARAHMTGWGVTLRLEDSCTPKSLGGSVLPEAPVLPAQTAYLAGLQSLTRGDWSLAGRELGEAGRGDLSNYQQGWSLWCAGDRGAAITTWARDGEAVAGFFFLLAESRYAASLFEEARSWIDLSLLVNQQFAPSLVLRGKLYQSDGNWTEALASYESAANADPGDAEAQYLAAVAQEHEGHLGEAERRISLAVRLKPHRWEYHALHGSISSKLERWEDAELHCRAALASNPNHCWSQLNLAIALARLQRLAEAAETMKHAARSCDDPELVAYQYFVLAEVGLRSDDLGRAIAFYEHAVMFAPDSEGYRAALQSARAQQAGSK